MAAYMRTVKSDESLIFKRLKELRSFHRIIMTGVNGTFEPCTDIGGTEGLLTDAVEQQHPRVVQLDELP